MQELKELLDFLKSKGLTNVKIPIDVWCGIIEFYAQKSNNLASSEPKPLANNKQTKEVKYCEGGCGNTITNGNFCSLYCTKAWAFD